MRSSIGLLLAATALAACDPTYCAHLHLEVATSSGAPAAGASVVVMDDYSAHGRPPMGDTVQVVITAANGRTGPVRVCRFLEERGDFRVEALGGSITLRGLRLGYPDRPDYPMRLVAGLARVYDFTAR